MLKYPQAMGKGSRRPTPRPRRGSWATPMVANGALVKARRLNNRVLDFAGYGN